jgi:ketosteroid isomerase-like protein
MNPTSDNRERSEQEVGPRNVEVVRKLIDAFARRDLDATVELIAPAMVFEPASTVAAARPSYLGHSGMRQYFQDVETSWDRLEVTMQEFLHAGSYVVAFGRIYAAGGGFVLDDPASFVWRVDEGKVVWGKVFRRREEALEAAGLWVS